MRPWEPIEPNHRIARDDYSKSYPPRTRVCLYILGPSSAAWRLAVQKRNDFIRDLQVPSDAFSSPDGRLLATAAESEVSLRDFDTGEVLKVLDHPDHIRLIAFSPDGHVLVSVSWTDTIWFHNTTSGTLLQTLKDPLCISPHLQPLGKTTTAAIFLLDHRLLTSRPATRRTSLRR